MMTDDRGKTGRAEAREGGSNRLQAWFEAALALPAAEREAWLAAYVPDEDARTAVRRLLDADAQSSFLDTPVSEQIGRLSAVEIKPDGLIGQRIGEFRLVRVLGRGGMAVVFLGERIGRDFHQQAAVKLLQRGLYSELEQRLFQRERQVLAALEHPNIAHLIDGGVTEAGIPYIVMEYVDGVPIADYVRENALDIGERLKLAVEVCRAVDAAHRRLIVHRDIKPSNILVTQAGEVKLLDFGIAKLLDDNAENATGTIGVFTPEYAAPEQKHAGAITTATDVYGLGVLLHELLTGRTPEKTDAGPRRPSSLADRQTEEASEPNAESPANDKYTNEQWRRRLRGDLDNIVLKALEDEPERRYGSAGALADDIERHLDGRPVRAHPPTRWYRAQKFFARHRGSISLVGALALAVFVALGMTLWEARVARSQAERARIEASRTKQIANFVAGMLSGVDPNRAKAMDRALMRLILDSAAKRVKDDINDLEVRYPVEELISMSYYSIGEYASAEAQIRSAIADAGDAHAGTGVEVRLLTERSAALYHQTEYEAAHRLSEQALNLAATLGQDDPDRLISEIALRSDDCSVFRTDACHELLAAAYAGARRVFGEHAPETLAALKGLVNFDVSPQRYEEGRDLAILLSSLSRDRWGEEDSRTIEAALLLVRLDVNLHRYADAAQIASTNLPLARKILGEDHSITALLEFWLGDTIYLQGGFVQAKPFVEDAVGKLAKAYGPGHHETVSAQMTLTRILLGVGDIAGARAHAESLAATMQALPGGHGDHGLSQTLLGEVLIRERRFEEAEQALNRAWAQQIHDEQARSWGSVDTVNDYVALYTTWGKPDLVEQWKRKQSPAATHSR